MGRVPDSVFELGVEVPEPAADAVGELLFALGGTRPAFVFPKPKGKLPLPKDYEDFHYPPEGFVLVCSYFETEPDQRFLNKLRKQVLFLLGNFGYSTRNRELRVFKRLIKGELWQKSWQRYFKPTKLGKRFVVAPPWEYEAAKRIAKTRDVLLIEPALAFGTGQHESTQLAAALVEDVFETANPASVLDVGTGTGILLMVAARLGATRLLGIDIDETAVQEAKKNLRKNHIKAKVRLDPPEQVKGKFELVVANIVLPVLVEEAPRLVGLLAPQGRLVLAGITLEQVGELKQTYAELGMRVQKLRRKNGWAGLLLARRQ